MLIMARLSIVWGRIRVALDWGCEALKVSLLESNKVVIIYAMPNC